MSGAVLLVGLLASFGAAREWKASLRGREHEAFRTTATDVAESLETLLHGDSQFVTSLRALLSVRPDLNAGGFEEAFEQLEGARGRGRNLGTLVVRSVKPGELARFQRRRDADPAFRALVNGDVQPLRLDPHQRHCLLAAGAVSAPYTSSVASLLQGDWCDPRSPIGGYGVNGPARLIEVTTDTGGFAVYPVAQQGVQVLFIGGAFYEPGARLWSVAARRAAVRGWVSSSFDITDLILEAIHPHRGISVSVYYATPVGKRVLMGRDGIGPPSQRFTQRTTFEIDGTWTAVISGNEVTHGISAGAQALMVFTGGAAVSVLAAFLLLSLARSRLRALALAEHRTRQLRHQALHDELTGLPNRALALAHASEMLGRAHREHAPTAALYLDLDGFKQVNDSFGHSAGDELLQIVARRLQHVVRDGDVVARLGGDEFVVLPGAAARDGGLEALAERILAVVQEPVRLSAGAAGRELALTASIGIASGLRMSAEEMLRDADVALYEAKAQGRNRYVVFHPEMQSAIQDRLITELDLMKALEHGQFELYYQPLYDLQSERPVGFEALARWNHPSRGLVAPSEFIPIAEANGMISQIGRWALREACLQASRWNTRDRTLMVAVNVSAAQLESNALLEDVRSALQTSALDPGLLTIEVTESVLMRDPAATSTRLHALKRLGVRIAIDDFGTGYSSLAYLREFPVDALKIDRSFVRDIQRSKQAAAMLKTLVRLAKTLEIATIAEGIEDESQLRSLQREGCGYGQGFLFSPPVDSTAAGELLEREENRFQRLDVPARDRAHGASERAGQRLLHA